MSKDEFTKLVFKTLFQLLLKNETNINWIINGKYIEILFEQKTFSILIKIVDNMYAIYDRLDMTRYSAGVFLTYEFNNSLTDITKESIKNKKKDTKWVWDY